MIPTRPYAGYDHLADLPLDTLHELRGRVGGRSLEAVEHEIAMRTGTGPVPQADGASIDLTLEKDVEHAVDQELKRLGFDVTRLSQPRASMQTRGIPDRYARHAGRRLRLWVEVKKPGGTVSKDQKRWHSAEREAGGQVIVVWSLRDLHDELRARGFEV